MEITREMNSNPDSRSVINRNFTHCIAFPENEWMYARLLVEIIQSKATLSIPWKGLITLQANFNHEDDGRHYRFALKDWRHTTTIYRHQEGEEGREIEFQYAKGLIFRGPIIKAAQYRLAEGSTKRLEQVAALSPSAR